MVGVYRSILETPRDLLLGMVVPPSSCRITWRNNSVPIHINSLYALVCRHCLLRQKEGSAITILLLTFCYLFVLYLFNLKLPFLVKNGDMRVLVHFPLLCGRLFLDSMFLRQNELSIGYFWVYWLGDLCRL